MNRWHWTLTLIALLGFGLSPAAADDENDPNLTVQQRKDLKQLRTTLDSSPLNANEKGAHLQAARTDLYKFLSAKVKPKEVVTDTLTSILVTGIDRGEISVEQSIRLSKEISKALDRPRISYRDANTFAATIDPLVQATELGGIEKMRLYRQALEVLKTAPNYPYQQPSTSR